MGEIADMMINGEMCQYCGVWLGGGDGFPTVCAGCAGEDTKTSEKIRCPKCNKRVAEIGLAQHMAAKHPA